MSACQSTMLDAQAGAKKRLTHLAFADALDRLEILLQEARHTQENIIYCLREPLFARILRYEELMLWDGKISDAVLEAFLGMRPDPWFPKADATFFARQCTIGFPTPKQALGRLSIAAPAELRPVQEALMASRAWGEVKTRAQNEPDELGLGFRIILREFYVKCCQSQRKFSGPGMADWIDKDAEGVAFAKNIHYILNATFESSSSMEPPLLLTAYQSACKLRLELSQLVVKTWTRGDWSNEQKRYYYNLIALQQIKRDITRDRLVLMAEGWSCLGRGAELNGGKGMSRFLLLRSAIVARMGKYIARLGDCQELFNKSQDTGMGLSEFPHPSGERRREQRLYDTHLTDRCLSTWKEFRSLAKVFGINGVLDAAHVQHRWTHDFRSHYMPYESSTAVTSAYKRREEYDLPRESKTLHFINSSYYMPDRPDIQPLITHEVGHAISRELMGGLTAAKLQTSGPFLKLLRALVRTMSEFNDANGELLISFPGPERLLEEMAADLLAGALRGPAYLWALYLELLGHDLADAFRVGMSDSPDPTLIDHIQGYNFPSHIRGPWYLRLKLLCGWLRYINESAMLRSKDVKADDDEQAMITGVEGVIDDLQRHLDNIGSKYAQSYLPEAELWIEFGRRLQRAVSGSDMVERAAEWRGAQMELVKSWTPRSDGSVPTADPATSPGLGRLGRRICEALEFKSLPEHLYPLDSTARSLLTEALGTSPDELSTKFPTIFDVPWQTTLHCLDGNNASASPGEFARHSSRAFDRMRALFAYALEWDIANASTVGTSLETLRNAVCSTLRAFDYCQRNDRNASDDNEPLAAWLGCKDCPEVGNWFALPLQLSSSAESQNCGGAQRLVEGVLTTHACVLPSDDPDAPLDVSGAVSALSLRSASLGGVLNDQGCRVSDRQCVQLQRSKIEKLSVILQEMVKNAGSVSVRQRRLYALSEHVAAVLKHNHVREPEGRYEDIAEAMRQGGERLGGAAGATERFTPIALGRLCFAGLYRMSKGAVRDQATKKNVATMQSYNENPLPLREAAHEFALHQTSVMGHYDRLIEALPLDSTRRAPRFHDYNQPVEAWLGFRSMLAEAFLPYHTRWEWAIPLQLLPKTSTTTHPPLAYISIILANASERLIFAHRLRKALAPDESPPGGSEGESTPCMLQDIRGRITDDDLVWFCDGWQDVLIEIRGEQSRMAHVFEIKDILHADPQVQAAEIVVATRALDLLCKESTAKDFDMRVAFRVNRRYRDPHLDQKLAEATTYKNVPWRDHQFSIVSLGRRLDYALYLTPNSEDRHMQCEAIRSQQKETSTLHSGLMQSLANLDIRLDKFQTDIYRIRRDYVRQEQGNEASAKSRA